MPTQALQQRNRASGNVHDNDEDEPLFGPERVVDRLTVPPAVDQLISHQFISVNEKTPLGTEIRVIEVTSNATGAQQSSDVARSTSR